MVQVLIGEAFIAVRADTTAFSAQVASAASAAAGAAGTTASKSFSQKFATGATALGKTMTRSVTLPLAGIGIAAGVTAANFETAFSRMSGLVGVSDKQLEQFRGSILSLAGETAVAPQELAEALYFITSSGQSGAQALNTLEISAKAATAGLGETKVIADTVTSAMAAYGPEALSAARATDILVAGVKFGKAEADELAAGLGNVAPLASQLGISFEDLTATIASMTLVGVDVDTAFTNVSAVMSGLLKTAPQSERALESVGLSSSGLRDTIAKPGGLVEAMRQIDVAFAGNDEAMAQVFPNIRALRGVMALLAQDSGQVDEVFQGVTNSTGSLDKAFKAASETSAFKFKQGLADLQVAAIGLGNDLLPVGEKILGFVSAIVDGFGKLPDSAQNFVLLSAGAAAAIGPLARLAGAGAGLVDQFTRADSGLRTFGSFLGGGGFAGNAAKGGLALAGFLIAAETIGPKLTEMTGSAEIAGASLGALAGLTFGPWGAAIGGILGAVAGHFGLLGDDVADAQAKAKAAVDALTDSLLRQQSVVSEQSTEQLTKDWRDAGEQAEIALGALDKMGLSFEDLNTQLAGGPVVMDTWIQSQVNAAGAAGASVEEIQALSITLAEVAPKWIEANAEAARFADVNNDASFFVNAFNNNLTALNAGLALNANHFAMTGNIQGAAREQIVNAGIAAVQAGTQMREEGVAVEYVNGVMGQHAGQLVAQVNQITGGNIPATAAHTAALLGIPPERFTNVHSTADIAAVVAQFFIDKVNAIPPSKRTDATFNGDTGPIDTWIARLNAIPRDISIAARFTAVGGLPFLQTGGAIPGSPTTPYPAVLHGGEYVLPAGVVDAIKRDVPPPSTPTQSRAPTVAASAPAPRAGRSLHVDNVNFIARTVDLSPRDVAATLRRLELLHG